MVIACKLSKKLAEVKVLTGKAEFETCIIPVQTKPIICIAIFGIIVLYVLISNFLISYISWVKSKNSAQSHSQECLRSPSTIWSKSVELFILSSTEPSEMPYDTKLVILVFQISSFVPLLKFFL